MVKLNKILFMIDSNINNLTENRDKRALLELEKSKAELLVRFNKMQIKAAGIEESYFKEFGNIIGLNTHNSKYSDFDSIQKLTDLKVKLSIPKNNLLRIQYNQMAEFIEITTNFLESLDDKIEQNANEQLRLCNSLIDSYNKTDRFGFHFSDFEKDKKIYESLIPTLSSPVVITAINAANSYQSTKEISKNHLSKIHTENFDSKNFKTNENPIPFEDIIEVVFETPNGQFQIGFNQKSELLAKRKMNNNAFEDVNLEYIEDEDKLIVTSNDLFRRYVFNDFKFSFNKSKSLNEPEELENTIKFPNLNDLIFVSEDSNIQIGFDSKGKLIGMEKNRDGNYSELALNYLDNTDCLVIKSYNTLNKLKSIKINYITRMVDDRLKNTNQFKSLTFDSEKSTNFPKIDSLIYKGPNDVYQIGFDKNNNFVAQLGEYDNFEELEINYIQDVDRLVLTNPNDGKRYMINDFQSKVEKFEKDTLYKLQEDYVDFNLTRLEKNLKLIKLNADSSIMKNSELKLYKHLSMDEPEALSRNVVEQDYENDEVILESDQTNSDLIKEEAPLKIEDKLENIIIDEVAPSVLHKPKLKQKTQQTEQNIDINLELTQTNHESKIPTNYSLKNLLTSNNQDISIITNKVSGQNKLDKFKSNLNKF
jgi:hypothetical protein